MKKMFSLMLFLIITNKLIASIDYETLISNKDTKSYNL